MNNARIFFNVTYTATSQFPLFQYDFSTQLNSVTDVIQLNMVIFSVNPFHHRTIIVLASMLLSSFVFAEDKPYAPQQIEGVVTVSAEATIDLILSEPELIIIDSRKKTEFSKGHIENTINILNTELTQEKLKHISPDKSKPILFYCNGSRCLRSSDSLKKAKVWGYSNLYWFRGGWKEWSEKRLPVVTD